MRWLEADVSRVLQRWPGIHFGKVARALDNGDPGPLFRAASELEEVLEQPDEELTREDVDFLLDGAGWPRRRGRRYAA